MEYQYIQVNSIFHASYLPETQHVFSVNLRSALSFEVYPEHQQSGSYVAMILLPLRPNQNGGHHQTIKPSSEF